MVALFVASTLVACDCLADVKIPFIEIHLSDIHEREEFRRHSMISDISLEQIKGHRGDGYVMGLERLVIHLRKLG